MSDDKNGSPTSPSRRPRHGSGDRNERAYVIPGDDGDSKGVDARYGPDYSESQGGKAKSPPPKSGAAR